MGMDGRNPLQHRHARIRETRDWCPGRESNPHATQGHWNLNPARLPVPAPRRRRQSVRRMQVPGKFHSRQLRHPQARATSTSKVAKQVERKKRPSPLHVRASSTSRPRVVAEPRGVLLRATDRAAACSAARSSRRAIWRRASGSIWTPATRIRSRWSGRSRPKTPSKISAAHGPLGRSGLINAISALLHPMLNSSRPLACRPHVGSRSAPSAVPGARWTIKSNIWLISPPISASRYYDT